MWDPGVYPHFCDIFGTLIWGVSLCLKPLSFAEVGSMPSPVPKGSSFGVFFCLAPEMLRTCRSLRRARCVAGTLAMSRGPGGIPVVPSPRVPRLFNRIRDDSPWLVADGSGSLDFHFLIEMMDSPNWAHKKLDFCRGVNSSQGV